MPVVLIWDSCMFAGNWFFVNRFGTYVEWAEALHEILDTVASPDQWRALLHTTATRVYSKP